jgi:hypothetical protein
MIVIEISKVQVAWEKRNVSQKRKRSTQKGRAKGSRGATTEGDKVKMSQRKTPNAKRKTQKQPHVAPHPINFF